MRKRIKLVIFDIDGVLTDGNILVDENGKEYKSVSLQDMDAFTDLRSEGYLICAITGENTPLTDYFRKRYHWDKFVCGCKDKASEVKKISQELNTDLSEICYIGDGKYDVPALRLVGLSICPKNATELVKKEADIVLDTYGGTKCVEKTHEYLKRYNSEIDNSIKDKDACLFRKDLLDAHLEEHCKVFENILNNELIKQQIIHVAEIMHNSIKSGGSVFYAGNGGSAADSQHLATELISKFYKEGKALSAEALTTNTSSLTAIANDYEFKKVFSRQLESRGKAGDIFIGLSTSGKSENILEAARFAKSNGIAAVLLTGEKRVADEDLFEEVIYVPSNDTPRIQEAHIFIGHLLDEYVEDLLR